MYWYHKQWCLGESPESLHGIQLSMKSFCQNPKSLRRLSTLQTDHFLCSPQLLNKVLFIVGLIGFSMAFSANSNQLNDQNNPISDSEPLSTISVQSSSKPSKSKKSSKSKAVSRVFNGVDYWAKDKKAMRVLSPIHQFRCHFWLLLYL